ncbi:MAG: hypothetical protein NEHIOOID_01130 [Holosporales bacterium]
MRDNMSIQSTRLLGANTAVLRQLDHVTKSIQVCQKKLSVGYETDFSKAPTQSTLGQLASLRIKDYESSNFHCVDGGSATTRMIEGMEQALEELNYQIDLTVKANSDLLDPKVRRDLNQSLKTSIQTVDRILSNVKWNNQSILTDKFIFPTKTAHGLFSTAKANLFQTDSFALGAGTTAVTALSDVCGIFKGDIQNATFQGNLVSVKIGSRTLTGDTTQIGANNLFTLTDTKDPKNHLTFSVAATDAASLKTGINAIVGGMTFSPNILNVTDNALFTGGVNINQLSGNYSGKVESCAVGVSGTSFTLSFVLVDGEQNQTFSTTITPPLTPNSALLFTSTTNANNKMAFNLNNTIPTPLTQQTLYDFLTDLFSLNGEQPAEFIAQNVPPYKGITISADQGTTSAQYQMSYTYDSVNDKGTFSIVDGQGQLQTQVVQYPTSTADTYTFANGVSFVIDPTLFNKTTNKGPMSVEIKNHDLYFQIGLSTSNQLKIECPDLSLAKLGLDQLDLMSKDHAVVANNTISAAINTIIKQNGLMTKLNKEILDQEKINEESMLYFEELYDENSRTDIKKVATEKSMLDSMQNLNLSIIADDQALMETLRRILYKS